MNLATTVSIYAGGPGSGCNPEVGKCGRSSSEDYNPADVVGGMKRSIRSVRNQNLDMNENVTVYHGKADVSPEQRMSSYGKTFYVTDQPKAAAFHGEVHQMTVPRNTLLPDTTDGVKSVDGRKVSGAETFHGWHSASLPIKYFSQLKKI